MRLLTRTCSVLLAFAILAQAEEPFSWEKTPGKLPKDIVPIRYSVRIEPDIEQAIFRGSETVTIEVRQPIRQIVLHSLGLEITEAKLTAGQDIPLMSKATPEDETVTFALEKELPPGRYKLSLRFAGKLTEQPRGLYLARHQNAGVPGLALATQMEATDCRRMFPCWDEPAFRAVFELTVLVPEKLRRAARLSSPG